MNTSRNIPPKSKTLKSEQQLRLLKHVRNYATKIEISCTELPVPYVRSNSQRDGTQNPTHSLNILTKVYHGIPQGPQANFCPLHWSIKLRPPGSNPFLWLHCTIWTPAFRWPICGQNYNKLWVNGVMKWTGSSASNFAQWFSYCIQYYHGTNLT